MASLLTKLAGRLTLVTVVMLLAFGTAQGATKSKKKQAAPPQAPAMKVVVVRSNLPNCEPLCPQWISAEGQITDKTPALFKKVLAKTGKQMLPVIVSSPGGDVQAALEIGEMLRARHAEVVIGWTYFADCAPAAKDCKLKKEAKGIYRGLAMGWNAYCLSACSFILASGEKRLLPTGGYLGVHQISQRVSQEKIYYRENYKIVNGKKKVISRKVVSRKPYKSYTTTKLRKADNREIAKYLDKMGVDRKQVLALFEMASPSEIHILSNEEAKSTRLVTDFVTAVDLMPLSLCKANPPAPNCVDNTQSAAMKPKP
jgi:hypothetical protein